MAKKRKGIMGYAIKSKNKKSQKKCKFGVNKITGDCLKHPRRKN